MVARLLLYSLYSLRRNSAYFFREIGRVLFPPPILSLKYRDGRQSDATESILLSVIMTSFMISVSFDPDTW